MPRNLLPIVATLFVTVFLWLSAVPILSWYEFSGYHQELSDRSFKWFHRRISDYSFEYERQDFKSPAGPGPLRIYVQDGKFVAAYRTATDESMSIAGLTDVPTTIDAAFDLAKRLLEERPQRIDISYDGEWHFPASITVSYSDSPADTALYEIRSFEVLDESNR